MRRLALISLLLIASTLAAYWPVHRAEFTNFDDPVYVTNNENVFRGLTRHGIVWAFTAIHGSNWHPLTWMSHMLDCQVFGDKAGGHHVVNVGFHAANAVLLFLLLQRMTKAVWRSAFVAALFALHPLHVESVAWISERKDVLSTFFGFLSLWSYARYTEHRSSPLTEAVRPWLWYSGTVGLFALGLLSKPMLVTLPFVMLLLDYWPLKRFGPGTPLPGLTGLVRLLREKLPFFGQAAVSCVLTFWAQKVGGAVVNMQRMPLSHRLANASVAYLEYLIKTFWPAKLAAYYPFPAELPSTEAVVGVVILGSATLLILGMRSRAPYLVMGWLWFVGTLVPVIGLVQVGSQAMADRYTYLPLVGLFVAAVWGLAEATARWRWQRFALAFGGAILLTACFVCTRVQVGYWKSTITLFTHVIQVTSNNALAEHNLGHALSLKGDQAEAIKHLDESIRIKPGYAQAYFNRGNAYGVQGKVDKAIADYREAILYKPDYEQAYCNLGKALVLQGRLDEARTNFLAALRCKPDYTEAHTKLGNLLLLQGATDEALKHLREAVRIMPDYDEGQYFLGGALARQKRFEEAAACFRAAIKANPKYISAFNDLAWILATDTDPRIRNVPEAVRLAQHACELTRYADPSYIDTLAVAQSEAGQLKEAVSLTEKATALARDAGDAVLVAQLESHLASFRAGRSYTGATTTPAANSP